MPDVAAAGDAARDFFVRYWRDNVVPRGKKVGAEHIFAKMIGLLYNTERKTTRVMVLTQSQIPSHFRNGGGAPWRPWRPHCCEALGRKWKIIILLLSGVDRWVM